MREVTVFSKVANGSVTVTAMAAVILTASISHAGLCSLVFGKGTEPVATQAVAPTGARTSPQRDAQLARMEEWQTSMIDGRMLGKTETPPMFFYAEDGVQSQLLVQSGGLNGVVSHLDVRGLKAGDVLKGTLLLPVSGHTGIADARKWAVEDKFDIVMQVGEGPNGDQFPSYRSPQPTVVIGQMLSTGLVTRADIEIPVPPAGKQIRLSYYRLGVQVGERTGMGAPDGYMEGRLFKISFGN